MQEKEVHISSLVIRVMPEKLDEIQESILAIDETEIFGVNTDGKIVVVVETAKQKFVSNIIDKINNFPGVINTSMIFHQVASPQELAQECL
jgi:nitrate reductase NapD